MPIRYCPGAQHNDSLTRPLYAYVPPTRPISVPATIGSTPCSEVTLRILASVTTASGPLTVIVQSDRASSADTVQRKRSWSEVSGRSPAMQNAPATYSTSDSVLFGSTSGRQLVSWARDASGTGNCTSSNASTNAHRNNRLNALDRRHAMTHPQPTKRVPPGIRIVRTAADAAREIDEHMV
jgi:hypothetical protein